MRIRRGLLIGICLFALAGCAGSELRKHRAFVVADGPERPAGGVRVTYLGTAGCLLESSDATVLVDPYFTREGLLRVLLNLPIRPNLARSRWALDRLPRVAADPDLILVTHGHFDHALDAVKIAKESRATLAASPSTCFIARAEGLAAERTAPMSPGRTPHFGAVKVTAFLSPHTKLLGWVPFPGNETDVPSHPPRTPLDWKVGEPLAFLVEMGGKRIYLSSGGSTAGVPQNIGRVHLAILGEAAGDDRKFLASALGKLRPHYFFPTHQDDFFKPLDKGFRDLLTADFNAVRRTWQQHGAGSKLILLDYFRPWTLR